jgi:hypothetical protein
MAEDSQPPRGGDSGAPAEALVGQQPRRGWQLPQHGSVPDQSAPSAGPSEQTASRTEEPRQPPSEPVLSLRNGVFGQVTDVSEGSIQVNQSTEPVATLRLERYDPHVGRTSVLIVRLSGGDALGFAETGDWVEAAGRKKSAYIAASRCINHTTGAVYRKGGARKVGRIVLAIVIVLVVLGAFLLIANHFQNQFDKTSQTQRDNAVSACLKSGSPSSFCESIP